MANYTYTVTLEDGKSFPVQAPDTVAPDAVLDQVQQDLGDRARVKHMRREGRSALGEAASVGSDVVRGLVRGGGLLVDALTIPTRANEYFRNRDAGTPKEWQWFPQGEKTEDALQTYLPTPKAEGPARQLLRSGLEGVGGALSMPMPGAGLRGVPAMGKEAIQALVRQGLPGAVGGVSTDLGTRAGGPVVGTAAGLLAGGATAMGAKAAMPNAAELAEAALADVNPANLQVASSRMADAAGKGLQINASQAMLQPSNLDDLVNFLAQSRHGPQTAAVLRGQPNQLRLRADEAMRLVPGEVLSPQESANQVQVATTKALKEARKQANAAYRSALDPNERIPVPILQRFEDQVKAYMAAHPTVNEVQNLGNDLLRAMRVGKGEPPKTAPLGKGDIAKNIQIKKSGQQAPFAQQPVMLWEGLDEALQGRGPNMLNTNATSRDANRIAQDFRQMWKETVRENSPSLRAGAARAKKVYEEVYNPLDKSVVGRMAGRGATETDEASTAALRAVFMRGTPRTSRSEILTLEREMSKVDPDAFPNAVKSHLAQQIESVMPTNLSRVPDHFARDLKKALMPDRARSRGLDDMLEGVAKARGMDREQADALRRGFRNFLDLLEYAERRPNLVTNLPAAEMIKVAGSSAAATAVEAQLLSRTGRRIRETLAGNAYQKLDKLLDTPEGLQALQELARKGPVHPGVVAMLSSVFGIAGADYGRQTGAENPQEK